MASDDGGADEQFKPAMDALARAIGSASAAVRAMPAGQTAFVAATELAGVLRDAAEAGSGLRSETARRIRDAERLSLAGLAERIGVSKARAAQLVGPASASSAEKQ
jgi:hypothetical protein